MPSEVKSTAKSSGPVTADVSEDVEAAAYEAGNKQAVDQIGKDSQAKPLTNAASVKLTDESKEIEEAGFEAGKKASISSGVESGAYVAGEKEAPKGSGHSRAGLGAAAGAIAAGTAGLGAAGALASRSTTLRRGPKSKVMARGNLVHSVLLLK